MHPHSQRVLLRYCFCDIKPAFKKFKKWCAHQDSNLGPTDYSTTTTFVAPKGFVARTIPSPCPYQDEGGRRLVSTPSTELQKMSYLGLARDCQR